MHPCRSLSRDTRRWVPADIGTGGPQFCPELSRERGHAGCARLVTGSVAHEVIEQSVSPVVLVPNVK